MSYLSIATASSLVLFVSLPSYGQFLASQPAQSFQIKQDHVTPLLKVSFGNSFYLEKLESLQCHTRTYKIWSQWLEALSPAVSPCSFCSASWPCASTNIPGTLTCRLFHLLFALPGDLSSLDGVWPTFLSASCLRGLPWSSCLKMQPSYPLTTQVPPITFPCCTFYFLSCHGLVCSMREEFLPLLKTLPGT